MLEIGTVELAVLVVAAISALVMNRFGYLSMRWGLAVFGCTAVGALLSPADLFSMLVMTAVLLCVYFAGSKHKPVVQSRLSA
jgi:Sec-independent protein secretion pathway component TatC